MTLLSDTSPATLRPGPPPTPLAALVGVRKRFRRVVALDGVDLEVAPGEVIALLGPNGAGKTTAVGVLTGLLHPDEGQARLMGRDPTDPSARRDLGVTPQVSEAPAMLRVREIVELVRAHYPAPLPAGVLLERFGLGGLAPRQAGGLSRGQQRRLTVALAFAGNPRLVVLDEPTASLDVESRRDVWQVIREHAAGERAVLLTTHDLDEAANLATRVIVLRSGRVTAAGTVAEIVSRASAYRVSFESPHPPILPSHLHIDTNGAGRYQVLSPDSDEVVRLLVRNQVPFRGLQVLPASLEDAFLELVGEKR